MPTMEPPPSEDVPSVEPIAATVALMLASAFELLAASLRTTGGDGLVNYAVVVGAVSLMLVAPVALVLFAEPLAQAVSPRLHEGLPHLSLILLAWWMPATFVMTFVGPFQGLCNGWFSSEAGVMGAFQLCRAHVPPFDHAVTQLQALARGAPKDRTALCCLALTSTALWIAAAVSLGQASWEHPAVKAWALIVGLVSFIMCSVYLLFEEATTHRLAFALSLALWWAQAIAFSFVPTSFMSTMNGFAAT